MSWILSTIAIFVSWSAYLVDKDQASKLSRRLAAPPAQTIMVGKQRVEGVENFTYLGSQLSSVTGSRTVQRRRMGIAASTMQSHLT